MPPSPLASKKKKKKKQRKERKATSPLHTKDGDGSGKRKRSRAIAGPVDASQELDVSAPLHSAAQGASPHPSNLKRARKEDHMDDVLVDDDDSVDEDSAQEAHSDQTNSQSMKPKPPMALTKLSSRVSARQLGLVPPGSTDHKLVLIRVPSGFDVKSLKQRSLLPSPDWQPLPDKNKTHSFRFGALEPEGKALMPLIPHGREGYAGLFPIQPFQRQFTVVLNVPTPSKRKIRRVKKAFEGSSSLDLRVRCLPAGASPNSQLPDAKASVGMQQSVDLSALEHVDEFTIATETEAPPSSSGKQKPNKKPSSAKKAHKASSARSTPKEATPRRKDSSTKGKKKGKKTSSEPMDTTATAPHTLVDANYDRRSASPGKKSTLKKKKKKHKSSTKKEHKSTPASATKDAPSPASSKKSKGSAEPMETAPHTPVDAHYERPASKKSSKKKKKKKKGSSSSGSGRRSKREAKESPSTPPHTPMGESKKSRSSSSKKRRKKSTDAS